MHFLRSLLLVTAALIFLPQLALADDNPAAPPGAPTAQQPPANPPANPPAPQNPATPAPKQHARKEEDEKAGLFARLKAHLKGTTAMADDLAGLQRENADLQARVTELENGTELAALRGQNEAMRADIQAFMDYAQQHGLLAENATKPAAPTPQTPMGRAAGQAVAAAVGNQLAAIGVPAGQLPAAVNPGGNAATLEEVEQQLKAAKTSTERQAILTKNHALIMGSN